MLEDIRAKVKKELDQQQVSEWVVRSWHLKLGQEINIVSGEPRFLLAPKLMPQHC